MNNSVMYTGVTSDLVKRTYQHRNRLGSIHSFCYRYDLRKLVYFDYTDDIYEAIRREKQIKAGSRENKIMLIENKNPSWEDLYESLVE